MSAQIVWTLQQLSEVIRVRITAGGENLLGQRRPRGAGPRRLEHLRPGPAAAADLLPTCVRDGRVGRYLEGEFSRCPVWQGPATRSCARPRCRRTCSRVAAVSTDGRTVYVGALARGEGLLPRVRGADLSAPSWDRGNNLWVVDRATGQLWYLANGANSPQQVRVAGTPAPTAVAVSRDGARVAMVVGTGKAVRVRVGPVVRAETANSTIDGGEVISIPSVREPVPDLRSIRDVAWADATTLAVLGSREELPVAPFYIDANGYTITDTEPLADPVTITAAPPLQPQENPLVVGTADGELMQFTSGGGWETLGAGTDPAYPG